MLTIPGKRKFLHPVLFNPTTKAVANAVANNLFSMVVPAGGFVGGTVIGTAFGANSADQMVESHIITFSAINKNNGTTLLMNVVESGTSSANSNTPTITATAGLANSNGTLMFSMNVSSTLAGATFTYSYVLYAFGADPVFIVP